MTRITPQEHARRLNMCLEAGLTVVYNCIINPPDAGWLVWSVFDRPIIRVDIGNLNFLVLRPGETVDNFVIED